MLEKFRKSITMKALIRASEFSYADGGDSYHLNLLLHACVLDQNAPVLGVSEAGGTHTTPATENGYSGSTVVGEEVTLDDEQLPWNFDVDPMALDLSWFASPELAFDDWFTMVDSQ